jgi:hypothetical protein
MNNEAPQFVWDSYGLTAYKMDKDTIRHDVGVRFDQFGIYGFRTIP